MMLLEMIKDGVRQMKAYLMIDYVEDFIGDAGALTLGEVGQNIQSYVEKVLESMKQEDWLILCTDYHDEASFQHSREFASFPIHCHTEKGRRPYVGEHQLEDKNVYLVKKNTYSAFAGTDLSRFLVGKGIKELVLFGVCSDICVLHTAIDGYNKGYHMEVVENACASFDEEQHQFALNHMKNVLGAQITKI